MKKFFNFIKRPPSWFCIIWMLATLAFLGCAFWCMFGEVKPWLSYLIYGISATLFAYSVYLIVRLCPKIRQFYRFLMSKNKLTRRWVEDYKFKASVTTVCSTLFNLGYCVLLVITAVMSRSIWIGCLTGYYFLLCITKAAVIIGGIKVYFEENKLKTEQKAIKTYKNTGIYLIVMAFAMTGMLVQMVLMESDIEYTGLLVYAFAAYTVYRIAITIFNFVKAKIYKNPFFLTVKNIDMVTAAVSLFSMQVTLIKEFSGKETWRSMFGMNLITGIFVAGLTICLGIIMIVDGVKRAKQLKTTLDKG